MKRCEWFLLSTVVSAAICLFPPGAGAQQLEPDTSLLDSVVWAGTAVEHDALILQAYSQARKALDAALRDRKWTAAIEQEGRPFRSLPPAIIMDVDETILNNISFQARILNSGGVYDAKTWDAWIAETRGVALPGAVEFTNYARGRGVTIFYVTNRTMSQKAATRTNLEKAGFPFDPKLDTLYCRGEKPDWNGDKTTRRAEIAQHHRILLLFGDDLGDFLSGAFNSVARRRELTDPYRDRWGSKWFMLPNAMYGSWESALYPAGGSVSEQEKRRLKWAAAMELLNGAPVTSAVKQ